MSIELIAEGRGAIPFVSEHLSWWKSPSVLLDVEDGMKSMRPNPKALTEDSLAGCRRMNSP